FSYATSPTFTRDGSAAYFAVRYVLSFSDPRSVVKRSELVIYRLDLASQAIAPVTTRDPERDEYNPRVSPTGRWLAYARSNGLRDAELRIRDLQSGEDRRLTTLTNADEPDN